MTIDTRAYDKFRQGIYKYKPNIQKGVTPTIGPELTGGAIIQNSFGQPADYNASETFVDADRYFSEQFIVSSEALTIKDYSMDGAIEPLMIRSVALFESIESPFIARSVKGEFGNGNSDVLMRFDQVVDKYSYQVPLVIAPFEDAVDRIGNTLTGSVVLPGYSCFTPSICRPFYEDQIEHWQKSSVFEKTASGSDMIATLNALNPGTDNLMDNKSRSSRTGFTYTSTPQGIDSVAFGGLLRG